MHEASPSSGHLGRHVLSRLGQRLRDAREGRYSVKRLSELSGVSAGLISEIERGKGNPSFRTLYLISRALGLQVGELIGEQPSTSSPAVVRRDARKRLQVGAHGPVYELLTPNLQGRLEVLETTVPAGFCNESSPFQHVGEECVVVQHGELEVNIGGHIYVLAGGDAITYDADQPHWWRNNTSSPALIFGVVTPPSF